MREALPSMVGSTEGAWCLLALCMIALILSLITGCASDPYPNDRSMAHMSADQLRYELSK